MKQNKLCLLIVVFIAIVVFSSGQRVWADLTETLSFVNNFNNMNGTGFHFINDSLVPGNSNPKGLVVLKEDTNFPVIPEFFSAYSSTTVSTFCIQPGIRIRENGNIELFGNGGFTGRLVYEDGKTFTYDNEGISYNLTVGAAYLYKAYITGDLATAGFTVETEIGNTIRYLSTHGMVSLLDFDLLYWLSTQLPAGNNWFDDYDPAANYSFMGNYQVFVLEVSDEFLNIPSQDFLFIRLTDPGHAPEPATILLWTLGAAGAIGYARKRSKMSKQIVS